MRNFRAQAQQAHIPPPAKSLQAKSAPLDYRDRQAVAVMCREMAKDEPATSQELRSALIDALSVFDGSEAQVVMLKSELMQMREAQQARQAKKPRAGRVGRARAYTQAEIDEVRKAQEARDLVKTTRATRKQGNANTKKKDTT